MTTTTTSTSYLSSPARGLKRHRRRRPWSDVPYDLLADVLRWLPGYGDRVRFRGVCRTWRAAERAQPRPPMPWIVFPGHCVSLHDAAIYRVGPLTEKARAATCRGSFDDWIALVPRSGRCRPFLLNTFTMARIRLPRRETDDDSIITKIVLSAAPDSESCTVAAIVDRLGGGGRGREIIVCRRPGQAGGSCWWPITEVFRLHDIIFFEGNIHAVDTEGCIHVFKDGELEQLRLAPWTPVDRETESEVDCKFYLVAFQERLLVVWRSFQKNFLPGTRRQYTCGLKVLALDDGNKTMNRRQVPIKNLDGHAIFVGGACSAAFAVAGVAAGSSRIKENQICFVDDERSTPLVVVPADTCRPGTHGRRPFRLQSYDVSTDCLRTYHHPLEPWPAASTTTGAAGGTRWQCIAAQRFPEIMAGRSPPETEYGYQLLLWEVMICLGAQKLPSYSMAPSTGQCRHKQGCHAVAVQVQIPKIARSYGDHDWGWSFVRCRRSVRKAKQAAAYEAVTFLRSRFHGVLDDSPWSSIPRSYHEHMEEEEEDQRTPTQGQGNHDRGDDWSDFEGEIDYYGIWFGAG